VVAEEEDVVPPEAEGEVEVVEEDIFSLQKRTMYFPFKELWHYILCVAIVRLLGDTNPHWHSIQK
jgi:hypothetical protein